MGDLGKGKGSGLCVYSQKAHTSNVCKEYQVTIYHAW